MRGVGGVMGAERGPRVALGCVFGPKTPGWGRELGGGVGPGESRGRLDRRPLLGDGATTVKKNHVAGGGGGDGVGHGAVFLGDSSAEEAAPRTAVTGRWGRRPGAAAPQGGGGDAGSRANGTYGETGPQHDHIVFLVHGQA